jgi:hypothetical protein
MNAFVMILFLGGLLLIISGFDPLAIGAFSRQRQRERERQRNIQNQQQSPQPQPQTQPQESGDFSRLGSPTAMENGVVPLPRKELDP